MQTNKYYKWLLGLAVIFIFAVSSLVFLSPSALAALGQDEIYTRYKNGNAVLRPTRAFFDQGGNFYHYRAVVSDLTIVFNMEVNSGEDFSNLESQTNLKIGSNPSATIGKSATIESKDAGNDTVTVKFSAIESDIQIDGERLYVYIADDSGTYHTLASFERKPLFDQPDINVELVDYPELGVLDKNEIYYLNGSEVGDLSISFISQSQINDLGWRKARLPNVNKKLTEVTTDTFLDFDDHGSLDAALNGNFGGASEYIIPEAGNPGANRLDILTTNNSGIYFHAFRIRAQARGSIGYAEANYYFVQDNGKPEIKAKEIGGDYNSSTLGVAETRTPQLRARIIDKLAGVKEDTLTPEVEVRYRPLRAGEDFNDQDSFVNDGFNLSDDDANLMEIKKIEDAVDDSGNTIHDKQVVVFAPDNPLNEGEYLVKVTATDKAGNKSQAHGASPFLFSLRVDGSSPQINQVTFNEEEISLNSDEALPVNSQNLELYLGSHGTDDLVYAIKYLDEEEDRWFVTLREGLNYVSRYFRTDYLNHSSSAVVDAYTNSNTGDAKNGTYEIFAIADEEGIDESTLTNLKSSLTQDNKRYYGFLNDISSLETMMNEVDSGVEQERRTYVKFKVKVDGNSPEYIDGSLKHLEKYPDLDSSTTLTEENPHGIKQADPVFELKLNNTSKIKREGVEITFRNVNTGLELPGVVLSVKADENNSDHHIVRFQSVRYLNAGVYTVDVRAKDVLENDNYDNPIELTRVFEVVTDSQGDMDFSIKEGAWLNVNQSSALEINIPKNMGLNPGKSLRITLNNSPVVEQSKIVNNRSLPTDDDGRYREENYLENGYYNDEDYNAEGFDVLFFENKYRILIFARRSLPAGENTVEVQVVDNNNLLVTDSVTFTTENYRHGFGFGRLLINNSGQ